MRVCIEVCLPEKPSTAGKQPEAPPWLSEDTPLRLRWPASAGDTGTMACRDGCLRGSAVAAAVPAGKLSVGTGVCSYWGMG